MRQGQPAQDRGSPGESNAENFSMRHSKCEKRAPWHLINSIYHSVRLKAPFSPTSFQQGSSDTLYPIVNFVTCNTFSASHQQFLAAIAKIMEPRFYHQVAKDPMWRKAMEEEI